MIGSDNWHSPELIERAGKYAEGAVFVDGFFPKARSRQSKPLSMHIGLPTRGSGYPSAQAYDAAMMIFSILKQRRETGPASVKV